MTGYFNLTNITSANSYSEVLIAVNRDLLYSSLGVFFLVGIWIILFISFKSKYFAKQSFAVASFVTMILSFMFASINLIPDILIFLPILFTSMGIVALIISGE